MGNSFAGRFAIALAGIAGAVMSGLFAVIGLTLLDLYIVGHGGKSISRPWLSWEPVIEMSRADVALYVFAAAGGTVALLLAASARTTR